MNNEIDPEILAIINGNAFSENAALDEISAPPIPRFTECADNTKMPTANNLNRPMNEIAASTNSLDSQGNLLRIGDRVVIGNDKAIGRIIKLGKYALVNLPNEGEFEFPCSILTLYKDSLNPTQDTKAIFNNTYDTNIKPENISSLPKTGKFESYTIESMINSHITEADLNSTNETIQDISNRLMQANDGQPFNMGIN